MADSAAPPPSGDFTNPFLLVALNPDGRSLARPPDVLLPPSPTGPVVSKDVPLGSGDGTSFRLYRPRHHQQAEPRRPLPLVVFHHGGGFALFGAASAPYHAFCENLAAAIPAVVASVDYRLAPEHRLPAAYDDSILALRWLGGQAAAAAAARGGEEEEEELLRGVDYSRCFLMGSSSGGNIVYHAGRRAAAGEEAEGIRPLRVAGHVYHQPYFGGVGRTASEMAMEDDLILPLRVTDLMWVLALPEGADRDHEFSNPSKGPPPAALPRSLVRGNVGDLLIDRQREFAALLRAAGVEVVERLDDDGHHAVELFDPGKAQRLFDDVRAFIYGDPPP